MRRLGEYLFATCTLVSLLLFVAAVVLWGGSYWRTFHAVRSSIEIESVFRADHFFSNSGIVGWNNSLYLNDDAARLDDLFRGRTVLWQWRETPTRPRRTVAVNPWGIGRINGGWRLLGFAYSRTPATQLAVGGPTTGPVRWQSDVRVPLWAPAVLFATPLLSRARRWRRARVRRRVGTCHTCGYDLRAHREGDRCPECGTPPALTPVAPPTRR